MSKNIHKAYNILKFMYHIVFPIKYKGEAENYQDF